MTSESYFSHKLRDAIICLLLGTFVIGTGEFTIMGLLPHFAKSLHINIAEASNAIGAYALGVVIGAPLFAIIANGMNKRKVLLLLMAIFAVGNTATVLSPNLILVEVSRFITGLPHGAFFGTAALAAASLAPPERRGRTIGLVLSGIMLSTIVGAPLCTYASDQISWRFIYGTIACLSVLCFILMFFLFPSIEDKDKADLRKGITDIFHPQVILTLLTGCIGFGGLFGVYTFLTDGLSRTTHLLPWQVTACQALWGFGMLCGNNLGGAISDRNINYAVIGGLVLSLPLLLGYSLALPHIYFIIPICLLLPITINMLVPALQARLMDCAGEAQVLAASLNHAAFNLANAIGSMFGAFLIAKHFGLGSPGWGGAVLSIGGLIFYGLALVLLKQGKQHSAS
ncbi:MFS transporter [Acetobacteraceae bacterium]|nr:MFS transporter [Acetobacteraceae bacterium]